MLIPLLLIGCSDNKKQTFTNSYYNKAIVFIKEEYIEVEIKNWSYSSGDTIKIETKDGRFYLTNSKNILMINDEVGGNNE